MNWFFASGDSPFFLTEQLRLLPLLPDTWNSTGLGESTVARLWIDYPFQLITGVLGRFGLPWFIIDKAWWLIAWLLLITGSYVLSYALLKRKLLALCGVLVFSLNTYTLLLFDGGQFGMFLSLGILPFVIMSLRKAVYTPSTKNSVYYAFASALLLLVDIRVGYIAGVLTVGFVLFVLFKKQFHFHRSMLLIPMIIAAIHAYWLLPLLYFPSVGDSITLSNTAVEGLRFFSFADFTHAFTLLHPNWPSNLFGKVSFFRPEFLILPIIAFSLLFQKKIRTVAILSLTTIICGAFLAKGSQEPLGIIYEFMFTHVPGFSLFRDPTKWYILVMLGYSVVVPLAVWRLKRIGVVVVFVVWGMLLLPVFQGKVAGNITPESIVSGDTFVANILLQKSTRTLWLPREDVFTPRDEFSSVLLATDVLSESSIAGIIRHIEQGKVDQAIKEYGISHIAVPYDRERKIFLSDYSYDVSQRELLLRALEDHGYSRLSDINASIQLFEISPSHTVFAADNVPVKVNRIGINSYELYGYYPSKELSVYWKYDKYWTLTVDGVDVPPKRTDSGLMIFQVPENGNSAVLHYAPQKTAEIGVVVSGIALVSVLIYMVTSRRSI